MRQSQLAGAIVALAAMVFAITFAMNYLGNRPAQPVPGGVTADAAPPARELTFRTLVAPETAAAPWRGKGKEPPTPRYDTVLECEGTGAGGHADFWFANENADALTVGLDRKNCSCSSVSIFLPPPALQPAAQLLAAEAFALVFRGTDLLPALCVRAAGPEALAAASAESNLLVGKDAARIPAGAVGWLRLGWKGEKSGLQNLQATVWADRREGGANTTLETHVLFHEALLGRRELAVGLLREEELDGETGRRVTILVWSSTRPSLRLIAESPGARPPAADPFVVGAPEPMTAEEVRALEKENNEGEKIDPTLAGRILCGYRVPVTLRRVSADGSTPFDLGPFRRVVTIRSPDEGVKPLEVSVSGRVRGAVSLASDDEGGGVNLSDFKAEDGRRTTVQLLTEGADMALSFDRGRTPPFLAAAFPTTPQELGGGRRLWAMRVEALPGLAHGRFPRPEREYGDSAIYLKATQPGKPSRAVRIPVLGTGVGG